MLNSSLLIFSIIRNLEIYVMKLKKYIKNIDKLKKLDNSEDKINKIKNKIINSGDINDFFKILPYKVFKNTNKYYVKYVTRIYNEIESGCYSHNNIILYALHEYLFGNLDIKTINVDNIKNVIKLYSIDQLNVNKEFMLSINQNIKIKLNDYFKINSNGDCIIYNLIKNKYVSPIIYLFISKKVFTNCEKHINFMSIDYFQFWKLLEIIKKIL